MAAKKKDELDAPRAPKVDAPKAPRTGYTKDAPKAPAEAKGKAASNREQLKDLRNMGVNSERFKQLVEQAKKEMEERRKQKSGGRRMGSRKPGA